MPLVLVDTIASGLRSASTFFHSDALDFQILGDGFDDPVAIGDSRKIVLEAAGRDQRRGRVDEKSAGPLLDGGLDAFRGRLRRNVQQNGGDTGIGKVGGDTGAHGAGAEDGNASKCSHVQSNWSLTNALPHTTARAPCALKA